MRNFSATFRTSLVAENVRRLRIVTQVLIGVIFLFSIVNITAMILGTLQSASWSLALAYVAFFSVNVSAFLIVRSTPDLEKDHGRVLYYERVVFIYVLVLMSVGSFISLFDQEEYQHLMVYTMLMLICSSFLVLPRVQILISIVLSSLILAIGLPFFVQDAQRLPGYYQHIISYAPVAYAISRVLFRMFSEKHQNDVRLKQEIEKNALLNEELSKANERLEALALLDELTGIANLRGLEAYLREQLDDNNPTLFGTIVLDVDFFKEYNDHHGHGEGDEVLSRVGNVLSLVAQETSGFVSRWGGEEFIYVSPYKGRDEILDVCKEIHDRIHMLKMRHKSSEVSSYVTLSQGACSTLAQNLEDVRACIQQADVAMYTTKKRGRNGYTYLPYPENSGRTHAAFV